MTLAGPPVPDVPVLDVPILDVRGLATVFGRGAGEVAAVSDVDLRIPAGRTLALVGESGSGKSVTSLSILRLLPKGAGRIAAGRVLFAPPGHAPVDLAAIGAGALRAIRGQGIGMVFQEPMTSLNPVLTVGRQVAEPLRVHRGADRRAAMAAAVRLLEQVGIPDPARRAAQFPHELSGGMRQRVTIAMALACDPALLIADEPTTALDVTIQAQVLDLLRQQQRRRGLAMLFVTHNLGVVAQIADQVAVMYCGRIVEHGAVAEVFRAPRHPYTAGLLAAMPRLGAASALRRQNRPLPAIAGTVPSLADRPLGCAFAPRCPLAAPACRTAVPPLAEVAEGHVSRCLRWRELPS